MAIAPQVLPGRGFTQNAPKSSLLFHWRAQDRSLVTVDRSSTGTLTRASAGGLTDGRGHRTANALTDVRLVGPAADNQPRWGVSTAGVPHLLLEDTRTNLMPIANPTTGWQTSSALSTGGETTVAPDGTLVTLLADNSTAAIEQMIQDVEVASTVAIVTWYTKWNGSTFGAEHRMALVDQGVANRGRVTWEFGSTGTMTITSTSAGNVISAPTHIGNNWWKTSLECTAISTGNDNEIHVTPALTTPSTATMFIAHIQVEDVASTGLFASSHIPTVSAAVTRAAEVVSFPFLPVPQEMTVYLKFIELGTIRAANARLFQIGSANGSADPRFLVKRDTSLRYHVLHDNGTTVVDIHVPTPPSIGDIVEIRAVLAPDGSVVIGQVLNGGAELTGTSTGSATLGSAWAGTLLHLNSAGAASKGFGAYEGCKVVAGTLTMAQCREAF